MMTAEQRSVEPTEGRSLTAIPSFKDHEVYWTAGLDRQGVCPAVYELVDHLLISGWIAEGQRSAEWLRPYLGPIARSFTGFEQTDQRLEELFLLIVEQALEPWVRASNYSCDQLDRRLSSSDWTAIASGRLEKIPEHYQWLALPTGIPVLAKAVHYERVAPISETKRALVADQISAHSRLALIELLNNWLAM
jgi:hypothetical protein